MNGLRAWIRRNALSTKLGLLIRRVEFKGLCSCGCERWVVALDGEHYYLSRRDYDRLLRGRSRIERLVRR